MASRLSSGCIKCKSRKLKCDGGKPACQRCTKIGSQDQCVYPDPFELVVRDQTSHAAHRAQLKWRQRATKGNASDSAQEEAQVFEIAPLNSPVSPSTSASSTNSEDPVIERLFYDWVVQENPLDTRTRGHTFLDFLPDLYKNAPRTGALVAAVSALGHANIAKRFKFVEAEEVAIRSCNQALNLVKDSMQKLGEARTNETLAAITLLGLYELLMSPFITEKSSWRAHLGGMVSLFNSRVLQQPHSATAIGQLVVVYSQMLANCITRGTHPSLPLETRDLFVPKMTPAYRQWGLIYRTASMCGDLNELFKQCLKSPHDCLQQLHQLACRAHRLDEQLEEWAQSLPGQWSYSVVPFNNSTIPSWLSPLLDAEWTPKHFHRFPSLMIDARWRLYRTFRLVLNQAILHSICFLESHRFDPPPPQAKPNMSRLEIEIKIRDLIDAICEQAIGSFDCELPYKPAAKSIDEVCTMRGYMIVYPLPLCFHCLKQAPLASFDINGRLDWISKTLRFVKDNLGFAKACAFLDFRRGNALSVQLWDWVEIPSETS